MPERTTNRTLTVIGLLLSIAMAALEATVVATAMPTVVGELHGISYFSWVTIAYLITSSVMVPIFGKLADIYQRKPVMLFGIAVFLVGTAASGAAKTMMQLIAFRAIQGIGAGAVQPITLTIVGDIFNLKERSKMQGVFGSVWGLFGLLGPIVGGLIVDSIGWRWVFYINLPFGVISALLIATQLHERVDPKPHRIDFAGAALFTVGVSALLLAASNLGVAITAAAGSAAILVLAAFFFVEKRAEEPLIAFSLFSRPVILLSSIIGAIIGGAMMGMSTFVPLYVQGVLHGTTTEVGSAMAPMLVLWPIASTVSGYLIPREGFRRQIRRGVFLTAAAGVVLAIFGATAGLNHLRAISALFGAGMGLANTALVIVLQTTVRWEERGVVTASSMFFRTIGGALAVAVMGGVLAATLAGDPLLPADSASKLLTREGMRSLDPTMIEHAGTALRHFSGVAFWIIAGLALVACAASIWFPPDPAGSLDQRSPEGGGVPAGH